MDKYVYSPKVKMSDGTFVDAYINAENIDGLPELPKIIDYFDKVITSQEELDGMLSSSTWNGATSVAIVGSYRIQTENGINVPANVKLIQGFKNCKLSITGYNGQVNDNYGAIYHDLSDATTNIKDIDFEIQFNLTSGKTYFNGVSGMKSMDGCNVVLTNSADGLKFIAISRVDTVINCNVEFEGDGTFYGVMQGQSVINTSIDVTRGDSVSAFYLCNYMTNCDVQISASSELCYGYNSCSCLVNCRLYTKGNVESLKGFSSCRLLSNCTSNAYAINDSYGYYSCYSLSSCRASASSTNGSGYGFYNGSYFSSCIKELIRVCTTALWGGSISKRDDDSCQL